MRLPPIPICFLHQAWRDALDQAVDMYGKLLEHDQKQVQFHLDEKLKAQRHAADRIMQHYQDLTAVLLDPDVEDATLRQELLTAVPECDLRVDQSTLANWTRGDPKARFQETAQRHGVMSRFAEPFLTRMNFLDEQHQGASPTLEACASTEPTGRPSAVPCPLTRRLTSRRKRSNR